MTYLLLDSASLYYRAYYSLPESVIAPTGEPVNAVRGFLETVASIVRDRGSRRVVACWDDDWRPQWRVDLVPSYKTHRVVDDAEGVPDTLGPQVDILRDLLPALGINVVGAVGSEADDVVAGLAHHLSRQGGESHRVDIASGDRDLLQLVDERTTMLFTGGTSASRGGRSWQVFAPADVQARFGVPPRLYADLAILRGDPSDGLPGVRGVGEKTAVALVSEFGGIEQILAAATNPESPRPMTPALRQRLLDSAEEIRRADRVVRLRPHDQWADLAITSQPQAHAVDEAARWGVQRAAERLMSALGDYRG